MSSGFLSHISPYQASFQLSNYRESSWTVRPSRGLCPCPLRASGWKCPSNCTSLSSPNKGQSIQLANFGKLFQFTQIFRPLSKSKYSSRSRKLRCIGSSFFYLRVLLQQLGVPFSLQVLLHLVSQRRGCQLLRDLTPIIVSAYPLIFPWSANCIIKY